MSLTLAEKNVPPQMPFKLDERLARDTLPLCILDLCEVRLMNNRLFQWIVLVPQVGNASEIIDLSPAQRQKLMEEISQISEALQKLYQPAKLNVAALGNQVAQLHIHCIARMVDDAAWPNPVWGGASEPYGKDQVESEILAWRAVLNKTTAGMA